MGHTTKNEKFTTLLLTRYYIMLYIVGEGRAIMKTYSVKEIADLLGTSQETVRRWIRDGKLQAMDDTKKKGENKVILESALKSFLDASPKYAAAMAISLPLGTGIMAGAGVTSALLAVKRAEAQRLSKAKIGADSVYAFLATRISEERSKLESMLTERNELDKKIQIETELLNQLIDNLKGLNDATVNQQIKEETP